MRRIGALRGAAFSAAVIAIGCSGGGGSTSSSTASGTGGASATSSSGAGGASASGGGSASGGNAGSGGNGGASTSLPAGDCFTFATKKAQPYTTACGDFMALTGAKIDLNAGAGSAQLCLLTGNYSSLAAVPTSYAACTWTSYIEGSAGLADSGVIVLDNTGQHHYRMWIEANELPNLLFSFAAID
jgi:hypothetical protein